jgi:hypothetical protein
MLNVTIDDFMSSLAMCCENVVVGTIVLGAFRVDRTGPDAMDGYVSVRRWADDVVAAAGQHGRRRDLAHLLALAPQGMAFGWLGRSAAGPGSGVDRESSDEEEVEDDEFDEDGEFGEADSEGEGEGEGDDGLEDELGVVIPDNLMGTYAWAEPVPHPTAFDRNNCSLFRMVLVPGVDRVDFEPSIAAVGCVLLLPRNARGFFFRP